MAVQKLSEIPTSELENDLAETDADIKLCKVALAKGITEYSGGSVQHRLEQNRKIARVIRAELKRREVAGDAD